MKILNRLAGTVSWDNEPKCGPELQGVNARFHVYGLEFLKEDTWAMADAQKFLKLVELTESYKKK